jgi:hypothetical protein
VVDQFMESASVLLRFIGVDKEPLQRGIVAGLILKQVDRRRDDPLQQVALQRVENDSQVCAGALDMAQLSRSCS